MFSLTPDLISLILKETIPSFQLSCRATQNLGFGFLYYGLVRTVRPKFTVVIGSKAGFTPVLAALAVKDNEGTGIASIDCESTELVDPGKPGLVHFIDPSLSIFRNDPGNWYGHGLWDQSEDVLRRWQQFSVEHYIRHFKLKSCEYLEQFPPQIPIDLLIVDGDHSYGGIMFDLTKFYPYLSDSALALAHDVDPRCKESRGFQVLNDLPAHMYELMRIPIFPGLGLLRKKAAA